MSRNVIGYLFNPGPTIVAGAANQAKPTYGARATRLA